jgi:hypothetical protein
LEDDAVISIAGDCDRRTLEKMEGNIDAAEGSSNVRNGSVVVGWIGWTCVDDVRAAERGDPSSLNPLDDRMERLGLIKLLSISIPTKLSLGGGGSSDAPVQEGRTAGGGFIAMGAVTPTFGVEDASGGDIADTGRGGAFDIAGGGGGGGNGCETTGGGGEDIDAQKSSSNDKTGADAGTGGGIGDLEGGLGGVGDRRIGLGAKSSKPVTRLLGPCMSDGDADALGTRPSKEAYDTSIELLVSSEGIAPRLDAR